ncbi:MAG TPA: hypothetical protein VNL69_04915 [Bacteroidota bacterium]|nr:hypothetical protein [Bacteroidota bacterium]
MNSPVKMLVHMAFIAGMVTMRSVFGQEVDSALMKQSSVVFVGTVLQRGAVSFEAVQRSEETAIVRVVDVLEKPRAVALNGGDTITLLLNNASTPGEGVRAVFYADGWIVGKALALKEVGHTLLSDETTTEQITKSFLEAKRQLRDEELRSRIAAASIVAHGKVVSIRRAEQPRRIITEHDPEWQEAVIEVRTAIKGTSVREQIVVRFPGSMDVAFYRMPKLKVGDEQVILAVRDTLSGLPRAMLQGKATEAYLVEMPTDVLPKEELERVQRLAR